MRRAAGRQGPRGRPTGNGARASRLSGIAALRRPRRGQGAVGRVAAGRGRGWAAGAGGSACALRPGRGAALRPGPALSGGAAPSGRSPPWQVRPAEVRLARLSAGPGRIAGRPSPAGLAPAPRSRPSRALSVCRSRDPAAAAAAEGLPGKQPAPREAGTGTPTPPPPPPPPPPPARAIPCGLLFAPRLTVGQKAAGLSLEGSSESSSVGVLLLFFFCWNRFPAGTAE